MKRILYLNVLVMLLIGCTAYSSGSYYTLSKIDQNSKLIEARRVANDTGAGENNKVAPNGNLSIKLNNGFIKYLDSVERPEVIIFVKATIGSPTDTEEPIVWQRVYLSSEQEKEHIIANKNSMLARQGKDLLPSIAYNNEEITIQMRIIELDQEENKQAVQLVNTAASVAAVWQPQYAVAISAFQTALDFIIQNNYDDIEFAFDLTLSENSRITTVRNGKRYDLSFAPRVGTYALIKTEHPDRISYPDGVFENVSSGLRYLGANTLKVGTLGFFNWPIISPNTNEDFYTKIFGRPYGPAYESIVVPNYDKSGELIVNHDTTFYGKPYDFLFFWHVEPSEYTQKKFIYEGNALTFASEEGNIPFRDQTYLIFSILSPKTGFDQDSFRKLKSLEKGLDVLTQIRTTQLNTAEVKENLDAIGNSLKAVAIQRNIKKKYEQQIAKANSSEELEKIKAEYQKELEKLKALLTDETKDAAAQHVSSELEKKIQQKNKTLMVISPKYSYQNTSLDMVIHYQLAAGEEYKHAYITYKKSDGTFTTRNLEKPTLLNSNVRNVAKITIEKRQPEGNAATDVTIKKFNIANTPGKYNLEIITTVNGQEKKFSNIFEIIEPVAITNVNLNPEEVEIQGENLKKDFIQNIVFVTTDDKQHKISSENGSVTFVNDKRIIIKTKLSNIDSKRTFFEMANSLGKVFLTPIVERLFQNDTNIVVTGKYFTPEFIEQITILTKPDSEAEKREEVKKIDFISDKVLHITTNETLGNIKAITIKYKFFPQPKDTVVEPKQPKVNSFAVSENKNTIVIFGDFHTDIIENVNVKSGNETVNAEIKNIKDKAIMIAKGNNDVSEVIVNFKFKLDSLSTTTIDRLPTVTRIDNRSGITIIGNNLKPKTIESLILIKNDESRKEKVVDDSIFLNEQIFVNEQQVVNVLLKLKYGLGIVGIPPIVDDAMYKDNKLAIRGKYFTKETIKGFTIEQANSSTKFTVFDNGVLVKNKSIEVSNSTNFNIAKITLQDVNSEVISSFKPVPEITESVHQKDQLVILGKNFNVDFIDSVDVKVDDNQTITLSLSANDVVNNQLIKIRSNKITSKNINNININLNFGLGSVSGQNHSSAPLLTELNRNQITGTNIEKKYINQIVIIKADDSPPITLSANDNQVDFTNAPNAITINITGLIIKKATFKFKPEYQLTDVTIEE